MGVVPNSQLARIINRYRYYILPSLYEGTPKTLLEAMACGLVCIGTDVAGINEIITDGVNGWLAKGTDADSIFEAIERAKNNPAESISNSAVETIRNKFSLENVVKKYARLLRRLENEC
jgi:glycosyltransferase involved in cell wall biosynthesis